MKKEKFVSYIFITLLLIAVSLFVYKYLKDARTLLEKFEQVKIGVLEDSIVKLLGEPILSEKCKFGNILIYKGPIAMKAYSKKRINEHMELLKDNNCAYLDKNYFTPTGYFEILVSTNGYVKAKIYSGEGYVHTEKGEEKFRSMKDFILNQKKGGENK